MGAIDEALERLAEAKTALHQEQAIRWASEHLGQAWIFKYSAVTGGHETWTDCFRRLSRGAFVPFCDSCKDCALVCQLFIQTTREEQQWTNCARQMSLAFDSLIRDCSVILVHDPVIVICCSCPVRQSLCRQLVCKPTSFTWPLKSCLTKTL